MDLLPSSYHREHTLQSFTVSYLSEATENMSVQLDWTLTEEGLFTMNGLREETSVSCKQDRIFGVQMRFL